MFVGLRPPGSWWHEIDALLAQAWHEVEQKRCPDCGQPTWLAHDPNTEGRWSVPLPTRCLPCTAIARKAEPYLAESTHPQALRFSAELVS